MPAVRIDPRLTTFRLLALALLAWVAWGVHGFPVAPFWLGLALAAYALALARWRDAWLLVVPIALPLLDLAPWSGRIFFDEFDLLVLTTIAILYGRDSPGQRLPGLWTPGERLITLIAASYLVSTVVGLWPPPPVDANAFASYLSRYNALRVAKGFLWAWLLWPHLAAALRERPAEARRLLGAGLVAGLGGVGLFVLWERGVLLGLWEARDRYQALAPLLDFTGSYRVTGPFSATHTGGAALDGYLLATLPFAAAGVLYARGLTARLAGLGVLALGTYAVAVTFTRTTYAAFAVAIAAGAVSVGLCGRARTSGSGKNVAAGLAMAGLGTAALVVAYRFGGYTGLAAAALTLTLAAAAGYLLAERARRAALLSAAGVATVLGAYLLVGAFRSSRWGGLVGPPALTLGVALAAGLSAAATIAGRHAARHLAPQTAIVALLAAGVVWAVGVPALGGYRMQARLADVVSDSRTRAGHWQDVIALRQPGLLPSLLGEGTGRFPAAYLWGRAGSGKIATYEVTREGDRPYLRLGSGDFNLVQRVAARPATAYRLRVSARAADDGATLVVQLCHKHLLYSERWVPDCRGHTVQVPRGDAWQDIEQVVDSGSLGARGWLSWPVTLMLHNGSGQTVDLRGMQVLAPDGQDLVHNGDFARGLDRWFLVSDFEHLAWHAKNLFLHLWVEQGWLGLAAFTAALLVACARLLARARRGDLDAVPLLPSLVGVAVAGLTDTLVDAPRIGTLVYLLLFAGLARQPSMPTATASPRRPARPGRGLDRDGRGGGRGLATLALAAGTVAVTVAAGLATRGPAPDGPVPHRTAGREPGGTLASSGAVTGSVPLGPTDLRPGRPRILLGELSDWDGTGVAPVLAERQALHRVLETEPPATCPPGGGLLGTVACWSTTG
jgi:hypothetical protein